MEPTEFAYLYALSNTSGVGDVLLLKILSKYGSPREILDLEFEPKSSWEKRVHTAIRGGSTDASVLLNEAEEVAARMSELGGRVVTFLDDDYPFGLRQVEKAPPILYVLGSLSQKDNYGVAVVGTRDPTEEGRTDAYDLAKALSATSITVISGLALGIDTAAHSGALSAKGRTIAVIGTGPDRVYPPQNKGLWNAILIGGGAVISQFPPGTGPARWTFPKRNWVMSGMAQGTIVVEASESSGAKLQAKYAAEQGRVLFLTERQVERFEWAAKLAEREQAIVVRSVRDVTIQLMPENDLSSIPDQLAIAGETLL